MGSLISLNVQKRKSIVYPYCSLWAQWCVCSLAVSSYKESMSNRSCSRRTWWALQAIRTRGSLRTLKACSHRRSTAQTFVRISVNYSSTFHPRNTAHLEHIHEAQALPMSQVNILPGFQRGFKKVNKCRPVEIKDLIFRGMEAATAPKLPLTSAGSRIAQHVCKLTQKSPMF